MNIRSLIKPEKGVSELHAHKNKLNLTYLDQFFLDLLSRKLTSWGQEQAKLVTKLVSCFNFFKVGHLRG